MGRKSSHISILQFDGRLISLLRVRRTTRGLDVIGFHQQRGSWSAEDGSLAVALDEFVTEHEVREDTVYTVLPRHDMTARIIVLPTQGPAEIEGMVRLSAEDFVPYPVEELVIDQCVLQKTHDGRAQVLAVFAHRDVVRAHIDLLRGVGIEPEQIYLSSACLAAAAIEARGRVNERFALVDLCPGGLVAVVIDGRHLVYDRGVASGQDWRLEAHAAQDGSDELAGELRTSIAAFQRESEDSRSIDAVYLCSEWADVSGMCDRLGPAAGCACAPASFAKDLLVGGAEHLPVLPLVSLGAALAAQGRAAVAVNLVPREERQARERAVLKRRALKAGAWVAAVVLALAALYAQAVHQRQAYIRELDGVLGQRAPEAEEISEKQAQLQILQAQLDRSGSDMQLLQALCDLMPSEGINITHLAFKHGERITIEGRAVSVSLVAELTQALQEAGKGAYPQFSQAKRTFERSIWENDKPVVEYVIQVLFPKEPEMAEEEAEFE